MGLSCRENISRDSDRSNRDRARFARLKQQLASRPSQPSGNTASRSSPKPQNQTAKTIIAAANPLKVTDLTTGEIVQALDICNRESPHDTETIRTLYAELNSAQASDLARHANSEVLT